MIAGVLLNAARAAADPTYHLDGLSPSMDASTILKTMRDGFSAPVIEEYRSSLEDGDVVIPDYLAGYRVTTKGRRNQPDKSIVGETWYFLLDPFERSNVLAVLRYTDLSAPVSNDRFKSALITAFGAPHQLYSGDPLTWSTNPLTLEEKQNESENRCFYLVRLLLEWSDVGGEGGPSYENTGHFLDYYHERESCETLLAVNFSNPVQSYGMLIVDAKELAGVSSKIFKKQQQIFAEKEATLNSTPPPVFEPLKKEQFKVEQFTGQLICDGLPQISVNGPNGIWGIRDSANWAVVGEFAANNEAAPSTVRLLSWWIEEVGAADSGTQVKNPYTIHVPGLIDFYEFTPSYSAMYKRTGTKPEQLQAHRCEIVSRPMAELTTPDYESYKAVVAADVNRLNNPPNNAAVNAGTIEPNNPSQPFPIVIVGSVLLAIAAAIATAVAFGYRRRLSSFAYIRAGATLVAQQPSVRTRPRQVNAPAVSESAVTYVKKRGQDAIAAVRSGKPDPGHVRDLADAALVGSGEAAWLLAKITLNAKVDNKAKQKAEGLAWLELATQLLHEKPSEPQVLSELQELHRSMDQATIEEGRKVVQQLIVKARRLWTELAG